MFVFGKNLLNAALQAGQAFGRNKTPSLAAALSFYTILSIAPLLIFAVSAVGVLFGQTEVQQYIADVVQQYIGKDTADWVLTLIKNAPRQFSSPLANLISIGVTLYAASSIFSQLYDALNTIWKIPQQAGESGILAFVRKRLVGTFMTLASALLIMAILATRTLVNIFSQQLANYLPGFEFSFSSLNQVFFFVAFFVLFMFLLKFVPDAHITWQDAAIGGMLTAILFTIGEFFIGIYLSNVAFTSVYGAAATVLVILVWVYYSTQIIFYGATLTYTFAESYGHGITPRYKVDLGESEAPG